MLRSAYQQYTNTGSITHTTNESADYTTVGISLCSNTVTIGGTQYHCVLQLRWSSFPDQNTLAMTTNRIFIWLDTNGPPKIIPPGYKPPLFGY